jgi:hypothetical protein
VRSGKVNQEIINMGQGLYLIYPIGSSGVKLIRYIHLSFV